ncbi:hypothetical protein BMS3Abin05_00424 [bacterium BMS3Abin05]|nr:hypothetical protein BMS3Abin05_00424 [bacterium BMS3Abin05]
MVYKLYGLTEEQNQLIQGKIITRRWLFQKGCVLKYT